MGLFPTGVTVVTSLLRNEPCGMTLNAFSSVSLDPRLVLVCLSKDSRTCVGVLRSGAFVVNLLGHDQQRVAQRFARRGADHFRGEVDFRNHLGLPELQGTLGALSCTVQHVYLAGDHYVVVGRVQRCVTRPGAPLLYFDGDFARYSPTPLPSTA